MPSLDEASDAGRERAEAALRAVDRVLPAPLGEIARRITHRDILLQASSLAFYGLISAMPLLIIAFAVVGAVSGEGTLDRFASSVSETGPRGTGQIVDQLVGSAESLSFVTLLFAVWPATAYGAGLRRALQHASGNDAGLAGVRGRLLGLGLVLTLPLLVLGGIPLMFVLTNLAGDGVVAAALGWLLAGVVGAVIGTFTAALLYQAFAPGDIGWRETIRGAALSAVTTTVFSLGFVVYLNVGNVEQRFGGGTSALVVLLGLWLFAASVLLIAGYQTVLAMGDGA